MSEDKFNGLYQVDDGYSGGSRPQHFTIHAGDLNDDMDDAALEAMYVELAEEDMQQRIGCSVSRVSEFVAWAREQLNKRATGEQA